MNWEKRGILFSPADGPDWMKAGILKPTPIMFDDILRIYAGFRDKNGVSRIGYVDLDRNDLQTVVDVSQSPVLDIGRSGRFDDNGVVPTDVVRWEGKIYLFYEGYKRERKVRFTAFGGLSVSEDGGNTFERVSETPVVERTDDAALFRVVQSVLREDGMWRLWYIGGSSFEDAHGKRRPSYDIRYTETEDLTEIPQDGTIVLKTRPDEYRLGKPHVFKDEDYYRMIFAAGKTSSGYRLSSATSDDGKSWNRSNEFTPTLSKNGWDSKMMSDPSIISDYNDTYLFYTGNNMGKEGFGYAIRSE